MTIDLEQMMQAMRPMLKKEVERRREAWARMRAADPERAARIDRQRRGEFTEEERAEARRRLAEGNYPPMTFGQRLFEQDMRAAGIGP